MGALRHVNDRPPTMNDSKKPHGAVPHSSGRNRFATQRSLAVMILIISILLVVIWVPW